MIQSPLTGTKGWGSSPTHTALQRTLLIQHQASPLPLSPVSSLMEDTPDKLSQKNKITKVDFQNANITECPSVLLTSMDKTSTKTRVKLQRMQTCLLAGKELRDKVSSLEWLLNLF